MSALGDLFVSHPMPFAREDGSKEFRAVVVDVIDGDTALVQVDLGGDPPLRPVWHIRIDGYNAAELVGDNQSQGDRDRVFTRAHLYGAQVRLTTWRRKSREEYKRSFERIIGRVEVTIDGTSWTDFATIFRAYQAAQAAAAHSAPDPAPPGVSAP